MSVGWSYSPTWTGQRGGDWPEPVRRQLRLPAAKNGLKRDVGWSHSSGLKREVDWPNSLKRGVAWPFSNHPEENWVGSSGRDWDNLVDSPKTFRSKVGGQKYVTDQVGQRKRCCTPPAQEAARWAARQSSSVRPSWWREAVEARSRERRRRLRRFLVVLMKITFLFLSTRWRQRQWRLRQRAENRCHPMQIFFQSITNQDHLTLDRAGTQFFETTYRENIRGFEGHFLEPPF